MARYLPDFSISSCYYYLVDFECYFERSAKLSPMSAYQNFHYFEVFFTIAID